MPDVIVPDTTLTRVVRRITASLDLRETLRVVAQAVVDQLGFDAAVVNMVQPGDICEVAAVAGPESARDALLGTHAPVEAFRQILASCESWGELRFLDHRRDDGLTSGVPDWVSPTPPSPEPEAWHPEDLLLAPLHGADGTLIGVLSVDLPIGGRRPQPQQCRMLEQFAVHAALAIEHARIHTVVAESEQLFRAMFDESPIAIALMTGDSTITRVNAACERLLGWTAARLVGRQAREVSSALVCAQPGAYEARFTRPDGSDVWGRVNHTVLARHSPALVLTQIEDITLLRTMQAQFAHAATHDQLTGLPNRGLLLDRLVAALARSRRSDDRVAVLYCDVDHFKEINDTAGHAAGDQVLIEIGRRLGAAARAEDVVSRFGGDEFVVIAYPMTAAEAERLACRVLAAARRPIDLHGASLRPSMTVGLALSAPSDTADTILAAADRALYRAKAAGRGRWVRADLPDG